jgi:hypothetical protein
MESVMDAVEELEQALTLDQAQRLADFDSSLAVGGNWSTQRLLDELLGRFEEDDSPTFLAHVLTSEFYLDSDE